MIRPSFIDESLISVVISYARGGGAGGRRQGFIFYNFTIIVRWLGFRLAEARGQVQKEGERERERGPADPDVPEDGARVCVCV